MTKDNVPPNVTPNVLDIHTRYGHYYVFTVVLTTVKRLIKSSQIKKFYKTYPYKSGNSDSKYNFEIFKNQNQTKNDALKFQKIKNIYKEASNQKVL